MTILITTIPDDPKEWAGWLEQHLVGLRLRGLVEELRLLPGTSESRLTDVLPEQQLAAVRQRGLSVLSANQIRTLLSSPDSLLELQEDVLINGGDFWTSLVPATDVQEATNRVRNRMEQSRSTDRVAARLAAAPPERRHYRGYIVTLVSVAAVLLIAVISWRMQPAGSGSILGQPGLLANNVQSSNEYLNRIADAGNEWFDEHPRDSAQLITLLQNVSNDCQILIDAGHKPLTPKERDWFVTKCRNWKKEFDSTLASLQSGELAFEAAQAEADKTMRKLVNILRAGPGA